MTTLASRSGTYTGEGINHENQKFRAVGEAGTVYHEEHSLLGPSPDGSPSLWVMSTNHPLVFEHRFAGVTANTNTDLLAFQLGDPKDKNFFRETIELELWKNGDLSYRYHWGMPGESCEPRSGARMSRAENSLEVWHVAIPVTDLERSLVFYRDALGFTLTKRDEYEAKKQAFVAVRVGGFTLELFEPKGAKAAKPRKLPDHVAFESENLSALRARLVAAGLPDINEVETFDNGVKYLSVNDPDGVRLDFFEGRAKYEST